jgi:Fur family ferric uptake transcriptional regulator
VRIALDAFHRHLETAGLKQTQQRDQILCCFLATSAAVTAEELHREVRVRDPRIGFTAVYRTLKLLLGCRLAQELAVPDGATRYEHAPTRNPHHIICTECGRSAQFFSPEVDRVGREIGRKFRYQPTRHAFQIYGLCEKCRLRSARIPA